MPTAAVIAITAIVAALIIMLSYFIIRLSFERRFRSWRDAEMERWQGEMERARHAAVVQSRAVLGGKFTEHLKQALLDKSYLQF